MTIKNVPQMPAKSKSFTNDSWSALEKRISQLLISQCTEAKINWSMKPGSQQSIKTIGNLVIARGKDLAKYDFQFHQDPRLYKSQRIMTKFIKDQHSYNGNDKSISILTNSQFCVDNLEVIAQRGHQMYQEQAYVYQYEKFGLEKDYFMNSLAQFESILAEYQKIE